MKSTFLIALAVVSAAAFGQKVAQPAAKTLKCPVMPGNSVNIPKATKAKMYADYKGRRYFFCCDGCPQAFKANPKKYAKMPSVPTPKKS